MPQSPPDQWTRFSEIFARAYTLGHDQVSIAEALLAQLSSHSHLAIARGIRRQWDFNDPGQWTERLPRETEPYLVAAATWRELQSVSEDCTSYWGDSRPDKLDLELVDVDWVSGTAMQVQYVGDWNLLKTEWQTLEVLADIAATILGENQNSAVRAGRPSQGDKEGFVAQAIRRGLTQKSAREEWFALHPSDSNRDAFNSLYNAKHLEIRGFTPQRGRPRKIPKENRPV